MDPNKEMEEKLRESACNGDLEAIEKLVTQKVNVNAQHSMNKWTALHWGAKRGHASVVTLLLDHGADKTIQSSKGEIPLQLASDAQVIKLLQDSSNGEVEPAKEDLAITPNYIRNPPFPYISPASEKRVSDSPMNLSVNHSGKDESSNSTSLPQLNEEEVVLKVRVANTADTDFIEVELLKSMMTFENLVALMCSELEVDPTLVQKVRKLPDTIVRKDKDVKRLHDFQELELVLTSRMVSQTSRNYTPTPKHIDVVY